MEVGCCADINYSLRRMINMAFDGRLLFRTIRRVARIAIILYRRSLDLLLLDS